MSRLWEIVTRRPPLVAPPELIGTPGLSFGFAVSSEPEGWTVEAYGADGRRLGRPIKSLSDAAKATLLRAPQIVSDPGDRDRLARAWVEACRQGVTNAEVLRSFSDAIDRVTGPPSAA